MAMWIKVDDHHWVNASQVDEFSSNGSGNVIVRFGATTLTIRDFVTQAEADDWIAAFLTFVYES